MARRRAASIPGGVAAFPNPRKLAQMLALREEARTLSCRVEGKSRSITGRSRRERTAVRPIFSISRPTPAQRHREPAMEIASVTPAWAPCITPEESCCPRPVTAAQTTDNPTSTAHTKLITIAYPSPESLCTVRKKMHSAMAVHQRMWN